jgi:Uma2 family endonuclease
MGKSAPKRIYTPDDLLRLRGSTKRYELVDGHLEVLGVSALSSYVAGNTYELLKSYSKTIQPGWVFPEGTSFQCFASHPDRVRKPDVCYLRLDRLSRTQAVSEGHLTVVPDFVVEVISPRDRATRVNLKLNEWVEAGVQVVWLVYPEERQIRAFQGRGEVKTFNEGDTLTAETVLPGFAVPVAELFRLPA